MKTLYVIALIIASGISLAAQERSLTEAEYTAVLTQAEKDLHGGKHGPVRMTMKTEVINEGRPETDYRLNAVTLIVPGQGSHRVEDRSFGGKPTKTESVTVQNRNFSRNPDGTWKELTAQPRAGKETERNPPAAGTQTLDHQVTFRYIGSETYNDRIVHVYNKSERKKTVSAGGSINESESTTTARIDKDGSFYRFESNTKNSLGGKGGNIKIVIETVADPTIKIAAPEVH